MRTEEFIDKHLEAGNVVILINDTNFVDESKNILKELGIESKNPTILCTGAKKIKQYKRQYENSWYFCHYKKYYGKYFNTYCLILNPLFGPNKEDKN